MSKTIVVMAGGTGGHVFPALAVAKQLMDMGHRIVWIGTRQGLEAEVVPQAGIEIRWITISGLRGKGWVNWLVAPGRLVRAGYEAMRILRDIKPAVVLGLGGFVTGPGGVMARLLGIPLLIHEQNAVAGLTNRLLLPLAQCVMEAFPGTFNNPRKVIYTGNPVRKEIAALAPPELRFKQHQGPLRLLVIGGSLGASALNKIVPAAVALFPTGERPEVLHQAGKKHIAAAQSCYAQCQVQAQVVPFIEDMAQALGWCDLVICRAGALTIAELAAAGVGAILIPFPHAVDDHQTYNGQYLAEPHAAFLVQEAQLNADVLFRMMQKLGNRERLLAMASAARKLAKPDATFHVAQLCDSYAGGQH